MHPSLTAPGVSDFRHRPERPASSKTQQPGACTTRRKYDLILLTDEATSSHQPRIAGQAKCGSPSISMAGITAGGEVLGTKRSTTLIRRLVRHSQGAEKVFGSPSRTRTYDKAINSRLLYQLSYRGPRRGLYTRRWRDARPLRIFVGFVCGLAPLWPAGAESPLRTGPRLCKRPVTPDRPPDPEAPLLSRWDVAEASWRSGYAEDCKSLHPGSIPGEASKSSSIPGFEDRHPVMAGAPHPVGSVHPNERVTAFPQAA